MWCGEHKSSRCGVITAYRVGGANSKIRSNLANHFSPVLSQGKTLSGISNALCKTDHSVSRNSSVATDFVVSCIYQVCACNSPSNSDDGVCALDAVDTDSYPTGNSEGTQRFMVETVLEHSSDDGQDDFDSSANV